MSFFRFFMSSEFEYKIAMIQLKHKNPSMYRKMLKLHNRCMYMFLTGKDLEDRP